MPTRENCLQLEALLDAAAALVETKKVVDKVEQEIRVLQARKAQKERGDDEDKKDGMDIDDDGDDADPDADADADGETDRAASAAPSARSFSRKRVSAMPFRPFCSVVDDHLAKAVDVCLFCWVSGNDRNSGFSKASNMIPTFLDYIKYLSPVLHSNVSLVITNSTLLDSHQVSPSHRGLGIKSKQGIASDQSSTNA